MIFMTFVKLIDNYSSKKKRKENEIGAWNANVNFIMKQLLKLQQFYSS